MDTLHTTAIARKGRLTVKVPARDGERYEVVAVPVEKSPRHTADQTLADLRRLRVTSSARIQSPDEVKAFIEEGRP